jgi:hypothetical protein
MMRGNEGHGMLVDLVHSCEEEGDRWRLWARQCNDLWPAAAGLVNRGR